LKNNNVSLNATLEMLVIDEADLLLSFGYQNEMNLLIKSVLWSDALFDHGFHP
jgi:superfamily II DNA/RNA helicase